MSGPHPLAALLDTTGLRGARTMSVTPDAEIEIVRVPFGVSFESVYLGAGGRSARLDPPPLSGRVIAGGLTIVWSGGPENRAALHLLHPQHQPWDSIGGTVAIMRTHQMRVVDLDDAEILWLSALLDGYRAESPRP